MTLVLRPAGPAHVVGGRRVRTMRFEPAGAVRLDAVCDVANAAAERLSAFLAAPLHVDVFEPVRVPAEAQAALFDGALVYRGTGRGCDLLVVLRAADARRLAAFAFREAAGADRPLSTLELEVVERIARELALLGGPLCGEIGSFGRSAARFDQHRCTTYVELRLASPVEAVIGLGIAEHAPVRDAATLTPAHLAGCAIDVRARIARTSVAARAIAQLRVGAVLSFPQRLDAPAELLAGGRVVGRGAGGVADGRYALNLTGS